VLDVGVHDDREVRDLLVFTEPRDGIEEGQADALLEHAAGEFVGNLEVEGARHDALRLDEADEPEELWSDAFVRRESAQNRFPNLRG
jgi:hypothetical protein